MIGDKKSTEKFRMYKTDLATTLREKSIAMY